jgi:bifunctional UDP-N-acetylglucosamine pyrophosphorylase/glucosamine-1-phosphate N-acetyltransferase
MPNRKNNNNGSEKIFQISKESFSNFDLTKPETAIILAAGHGKRIKSKTSKMLHQIWGKPTVERVYEACESGLGKVNMIVVVGVKAEDVIHAVGTNHDACFAYQAEQNGTGHAVQMALDFVDEDKYDGIVYILPGDMGLIDKVTISRFKNEFISSGSDMMVLTGLYGGNYLNNNYGRIVRVNFTDIDGNPSGEDNGKVIEIMEFKDILAMDDTASKTFDFKGRTYSYSKDQLLRSTEFNSGVYAIKFKHLHKLINEINSDNVQNEIYITDLISIFNNNGLSVGAVYPDNQSVLIGFNNKSVLREMENIARNNAYKKIKDIVEIEDPDDFYIHDEVINQIIEKDNAGQPLDIKIGKGVYLGKGVELNYNLTLKRNTYFSGGVIFGKNNIIEENAYLSAYPGQYLILGDNVQVLWGNIIKGNIIIGDDSRIESSVNMTGSDEFPLRIGRNVTIKGTSYLFGSTVEDDVFIEHSVLIKKYVKKVVLENGEIQKVMFYLPSPVGKDTISDI